MRLLVVGDGAGNRTDANLKAVAHLLQVGLHLQAPPPELVGNVGDEMAVEDNVRDGVDGIETEDDGRTGQQIARHVEGTRKDPVPLGWPLAFGLVEPVVGVGEDSGRLKSGVVVTWNGGGTFDFTVSRCKRPISTKA